MDYDRSPQPALSSGLRGLCPRCGRGRIFEGFLAVRPKCEVCGLDLAFIDSGDGPAFFVMSIVSVIVVGLAMWVEFTFEPSLLVHMALWLPLSVILGLGMVRPAKGLMIALQFRHKAEEGRLQL